ncbi:MAG TPA: helix-turn-helix domain-containing protein [Chloroflexota bacterium]
MIDANELSEQLGGQISPHTLRKLARKGRITGATRIGNKILFDSRTAGWMIQPLDCVPLPASPLLPAQSTNKTLESTNGKARHPPQP